MVETARSWIKENSTMVFFLLAQAAALAAGGASMLAYMVKLETRVHTMEHRGAEYTVARMDEMKQRITVLEQSIRRNEISIERIVDRLTRDVGK
jgi:hypothetical protein